MHLPASLRASVIVSSLLLAAAVETGCSSPIVGTRKSADNGAATVLKIDSDHTYTATVTPRDGARTGSSGSWEKESDTRFRLIQEAGDWPRVVRAELSDKRTLGLFGQGVTTQLKKD